VSTIPVPSASVFAALNPGNFPPYSGPTGSIEGDILVKGDEAPAVMGKSFVACPEAAETYQKAFREGPRRADGARTLADAIIAVQIMGSGLFVPERNEAQTVFIDRCAFSARTIVLTYGQRLEVKNLEPAGSRRLYAPAFVNQSDPALMIAPPGGADPVKLYPKKMGRYLLGDKLKQDWMEADVFVIGHPLHAVSDAKGHYRLDGIPIGKRTINVRHPAVVTADAKGVDKEVEIRENVVLKLDVTLDYAKPKAPPPSDAGTELVLP
jgi:hypothetical protein